MKSKLLLLIGVLAMVGMACSVPGLSSFMSTETPIPTNTRAPTLTPQPSETPIPTVDAATDAPFSAASSEGDSEDVAVIDDYSYSIDTWDYIVGIVQNNSDETIMWLELTVLIYNESGSLIATESVYPFLDKLAPGETSPFTISSDAWGNGSTYDFLVEGYETADEPTASGLEILSHTSYSDDYYLNLIGEIQNNSDKPISFVKVAAALYAADGSLLNANYSYAMVVYLAPGQKSPFNVWFSDGWEEADSYEITAQGEYDESYVSTPVEVLNFNVTREDEMCTVTGTAKNNGSQELSYATLVSAFYDSSNNLLWAEWSYTEADTLPAGGTSPFTISVYDCPDYDHVEVYSGN